MGILLVINVITMSSPVLNLSGETIKEGLFLNEDKSEKGNGTSIISHFL